MPNDTVRANAQAMPIGRRAALGSLAAAAGLLAVPKLAKAAGDDADIFAAVERVKELREAEKVAGDRYSALERLLPTDESVPALRVREGDAVLLNTDAEVGTVLPREILWNARDTARAVKAVMHNAESHPLFGPVLARLQEILDADAKLKELRETETTRIGFNEAEAEFGAACSATSEAAEALLELRPRTLAGVRAVVDALKYANFFDFQQDAERIADFLLEAPALAVEA